VRIDVKDLYNLFRELRDKNTRNIIGLVSGTSADGVTAVLARITGTGDSVGVELVGCKTYPYSSDVRYRVFELFKPSTSCSQNICEMNFVLGEVFAEAALKLIDELGLSLDTVDLVGSHGQTIWHQPSADSVAGYSAKSTLQIGEPAIISERTGLPVISDFRKSDIAVGGEGAPLTPYLDYVLHKTPYRNRVLQNIGGIANLTYLPAGAGISGVVAFDTGPGNMIIDALVKRYTGATHDIDGKLAIQGEVCRELLDELLEHPYYSLKPPKTTGRETFGEHYSEWIAMRAEELGLEFVDTVATVSMLTVETITRSIRDFLPSSMDEIYVSGGGALNPVLINGLRTKLSSAVFDYSVLGIPGEAKEALLMALLANEHVMDTPCNVVSATGAQRQVILGNCTRVLGHP
jgi:anhydro-N-acetylmuramic acid kinase